MTTGNGSGRSGRSGRADHFVLAVDLGTGGPKIGLVSLTGCIAWTEHFPVETRWLEGGGAVQDADEWWQIIADASRKALATGPVRPEDVAAVSITGQWASTVPVDAEGHPVGDCVMWMDTRGAPYSRRVVGGPVAGYAPAAAAAWIRRSGAPPSPFGDDSLGHMLYLENEQPEVARASRWYLEPVDYLSMRFTGVAAASPASMTASWLTDTRSTRPTRPTRSPRPTRLARQPGVSGYDPILIRRSGVNGDRLPPLRPTVSVIGPVQRSVSKDLGLPESAVVVTGTLDLHSAAVGAGAVIDYEPHMALSTTSWISCPVPAKKTDLLHQMATVAGLGPDGYLLANNQDSAGRCLEWLRTNVLGGMGYPEMFDLAAAVPAGSGDVIFTPWLKGERCPVADRTARGGFHNLSLAAGRPELVRAVLEGVAYNSRWLLAGAESFTDRRLEPIRLIGGGARSDLWCQIIADVLDRRIERVADPLHANLRGAAIFAGLALGEIQPTEVRALVPVDRVFRPDRTNRAVYDRLSSELPRLYKAQKGISRRLNRRSTSEGG
ncbi:MAG TPA: FGGY-family carbohydrate kinase [Acidimicrobiales bacterium]|nr:FGGY-family carbohydrate kinase [Acidimicrobiales bacterium]